MKKLIIIALFIASPLFAESNVQIHAITDKDGLVTAYDVITWNGKDLAMIKTRYTPAEAQQLFPSILDPAKSGTSVSPTRVFLTYNDDGTPQKVVCQATSEKVDKLETTKPEDASIIQDATTLKTDVETKTGKDIDGGEIKVGDVIIENP